MGRSRRSIRVTSPPASRAAAAATRISFLFKASVLVGPANARILGLSAMGAQATSFSARRHSPDLAAGLQPREVVRRLEIGPELRARSQRPREQPRGFR